MPADQQPAAAANVSQAADGSANGHKTVIEGLDALEWRCVGPHRGGRVVAVAGDPVDPMVFYFGACAGGYGPSRLAEPSTQFAFDDAKLSTGPKS